MKSTQNRLFRCVVILVVVALVGIGILLQFPFDKDNQPDAAPDRNASLAGLREEGEIAANTTAWEEIDDASRDGWQTEILAEQVGKRLDELGAVAFAGKTLSSSDDQRICSPDFVGDALLPKSKTQVYDDGVISIDRWTLDNEQQRETQTAKGVTGFRSTLATLAAAWTNAKDVDFKFKVIRVSLSNSELRTRQIVSSRANLGDRLVEQHATWDARWTLNESGHVDQLRSLRLIEFEQARCASGQSLFSDVAASVLKKNECYQKQFQYGLNHWLDRNQDMRYFSPLGNPGLAIGDVNGDGLDDLYVCQESNLPNRLFLQQPDGTAVDVSSSWQVDWLESSRSALFVDLDNDGDQDLAMAILGGVVIASNEGSRFIVRDVLATDDDTTSLSAADYDLDGRLDLYVCVDYPNDTITSERTTQVQVGAGSRVYHDSNSAGRNTLFRNQHSAETPWKFSDVTEQCGLSINNSRFTWAASWEDYDNDGDQDLYVANDFGRNNLYRNDGGLFADIAATARAEDSASGMSVAWADVNRDGNMDVYISNMFSSAGSRITHQPKFKQNASSEIRSRLQRFARGSSLLQNSSDGTFEDISVRASVTLGRWAWGSNFLDINNDGWQDIAVANGYITSENSGDL